MNFDSTLRSFIPVKNNNDFPIQNIPFGIGKTKDKNHFACSIIGNKIIDLEACVEQGLLDNLDLPEGVFSNRFLNDFMSLGNSKSTEVRNKIQSFMKAGGNGESLATKILIDVDQVDLLLPIQIGDYTDFYSSIEHATNVGCLFRDPKNALLPNWKHIPVGYHGRSSSMVVSGTEIHRPLGQMKPKPDEAPIFGPSRLMDFELEMGFVVGKSTDLGSRVKIKDAEDHIFGLMLFNDWSARDIQGWEYVPLGPFLGKNFASTLSPWIVTMEALEPFRVEGPKQDPQVFPYLEFEGKKNYDIHLEVEMLTESGSRKIVSESNFKYMYWNMCQQLAHHTINGCNINIGDMYASGTISGPTEDSYGSLLEITWKGSKTITFEDGTERKFIQDNDTIIMRGYGIKDGIRIGLGEVVGKILPVKED